MNGKNMTMTKIVVILMLNIPTLVYANNKGIEGDWLATLTGMDRSFIITISTKPDGTLSAATMGIPYEEIIFENGKLHLAVKSGVSGIEGTLQEDGRTIEGQWLQQGKALPIVLERVDKVGTKIGGDSDTEVARASKEQLQNHDKLVAWWKFDNDANDSAGASHGSIHGDPTFVAGKLGQAMSLDGDDYVDCGNANVLNFGTGDWTVSAWIKTTQTGTDEDDEHKNRGTVFANGGDQTGGIRYALIVNETILGRVALVTDDDTARVQATTRTVVNDGIWHHVVGMRNADQLRIYVDGKLGETSFIPTGHDHDLSGVSQHNAYIGAITDNRDNSLYKRFVGLIDEVCVFACALDANSVSALYSGSDPRIVAKEAKAIIEPQHRPQEANDVDIEGDWKGTVETLGQSCIIKIRKKTDGTLAATLTAKDPEGNPMTLPFDEVTFINGKLHLEAVSIQGIYEGTINADGLTIAGQWQQQGQTSPLVLKRVEQVQEAEQTSQEQFQDRKSGTSNIATTLILILVLAGVIAVVVLFVVKSSIRR